MSADAVSSESAFDTPVGVLGKYRLIAHLGQGGMADVHLATNTGAVEGFNKLIVLKFLRKGYLEDHDVVQMFLDEARLAARLSHPNVVQTYEVGVEEERPCIVMEYLDGQPLSQVLRVKDGGAVPLELALLAIADTLSALHYAHELADFDGTPLQLVHRDVSPHNVFVTYDGQVKLLDFGIAKATTSSSETRTGVLKGKVAYMAPEQMLGEAVDRRADVFGTGVMLWEAATGERLWRGKSDVAVIQRVVSGEVPTPSSVKPDVDPELERIILKAMARKPEERYATALELQADVEAFLGKLPAATHRGLAKWMTANFAEHRAKVRAVIDAQLAKLKSMPTGEYRSLASTTLAASRSGSAPQLASLPSLGSGSGSGTSASGSTPSRHGSQPSYSNPADAADAPKKRSNVVLIVGAVAALAAVGVVASVLRQDPSPAATPPVASAPAIEPNAVASAAPVASASAAPAAAPTEVEVSITVVPEQAKLFLDGAALATNPWKGKVKRDALTHEIRAEAEGYSPKAMRVELVRDVSVSLSLEKGSTKAPVHYVAPPKEKAKPDAAPPPAPEPVVAAPAPTPTPTPAPTPTSTGKPKRPIDKANPWEN